MRVTASTFWVPVLAIVFAELAVTGGILLALGARVPISPYVTTISFTIYLICRGVGAVRQRRGWSRRATVAALDDPAPGSEREPALTVER
jgi:zinc/manganese transport system permease protein